QLWQWVTKGAVLDDGRTVDAALYRALRDEEVSALRDAPGGAGFLDEAVALMDDLVLADEFILFLTLPGYDRLIRLERGGK
ncbi:MAG: malate synthase A, partial [Acidobacteriota bacterium]